MRGISDSARLERRYRRLLACYPRAFRRENEEEILAVLLDCAQDGQRRPGLAASVDLLKGAARARLWGTSHPPRTVRTAVRLIGAAAVAQLAVLIITVVTAGGVRSAVAHSYPGVAAAQHSVDVNLITDYIGDSIGVLGWLALAWWLARRRNWARIAVVVNVAGASLGLLIAVAQGSVEFATADLIASTVVWLIVLAAGVLLFSGAANRYYHPQPRPVTPWRGTFGTM